MPGARVFCSPPDTGAGGAGIFFSEIVGRESFGLRIRILSNAAAPHQAETMSSVIIHMQASAA